MAIAFSCSCGKAMKAKEVYAGRKVKCPQCDRVVTIPQMESDDDALTVTPIPSNPDMPLLAKPAVRPSFTPVSERAERERPAPPPLAMPVAQHAHPEPKAEAAVPPERASVHAWVDQSLTQHSTPWLPGDEECFQQGVCAPREGMSGLEIGVLGLVVLAAVAGAGWIMIASN